MVIRVRWLNGDEVDYPHCDTVRQLQFAICNELDCCVNEVVVLDAENHTPLVADPCPSLVAVVIKTEPAGPWEARCDLHLEDRVAFGRMCAKIPSDAKLGTYFAEKCANEDVTAIEVLLERFYESHEEEFAVVDHFTKSLLYHRIKTAMALADAAINHIELPERNKLFVRAATRNAPGVAQSLLRHNADPNALLDGSILMHICSQIHPNLASEYAPLLETLLTTPQYALDVNAQNNGGDSALIMAISNFLAPIAVLLLEHGANVNCANERGLTPLHMAVLVGNGDLVELLVAKNGNVNAVDARGVSILDVAVDRQEKRIKEQLVQLGACVQKKKWWRR